MANQSLELNKNLKLLVKSSIIVFIGLLLSKILFYGYRIIIARYLGPEVYGALSISISLLGWFIAISLLGLSDGLLRYIALYRAKKEGEKIRYVFKLSIFLVLILSILSGLFLFFTSEIISSTFFHNSNLTIFLRLFSILIPITTISYIFLSVIKAYEKIGTYSFILNVSQNLFKLLFLILFLLFGMKNLGVALSYILGALVMLIISYYYCKVKIAEIWGRSIINKIEKNQLKKELITYSWPLLFFAFVSSILPSIDSIFLGHFKDITAVGFYNSAVPLAMLINFAAEIFMQLFFPLITRNFYAGNMKLVSELSKQVGKWVFIINLPLLLVMVIFPGTILNFLFGPEYLIAESSLRILSIGVFFSAIFMISDNLITISGRSKLTLLNIFLSLLVDLLLCIIFIPMFGMFGAALSTSISLIFGSALRGFQSYYYLSILPLRRKMFRILLISIIPTIFLIYIKDYIIINPTSLIIIGISFILLYVFLLYITGCFDKNDLMILEAFKRKIFGLNKIKTYGINNSKTLPINKV